MDRMDEKHYEELFNRLLDRGRLLHASNKKRIRAGLISLAVFTVGMVLIRFVTESDRATFLIIWVIGMFAISVYLIGVEYIDSSVEKTLEDVTERESGWDDLITDSEAARGRLQERIDGRRDDVMDRLNERRDAWEERLQSRRETLTEEMTRTGAAGSAPESEDEA